MAAVAAALPYIMMAGTAISAGGTVLSGLSQSKMAQYSADVAREESRRAAAAGALEKARTEAEGQKLLSRQQVLFSKAGVDTESGSPLAVMMDTAADIERDALVRQYNYQIKAAQAESASRLQERYGEGAFYTGLLGGAVQSFKGAADILKTNPLSAKASWGIS